MIKVLDTEDKQKILDTVRKKHITNRKLVIQMIVDLSSEKYKD